MKFRHFRHRTVTISVASSRLTGQRLVSEMTRLFWPRLDRSAARVIEQRVPYRNSLRKVFPPECHKTSLIRTVLTSLTGGRLDLNTVLQKTLFCQDLLHFRILDMILLCKKMGISWFSVFLVFSVFSGFVVFVISDRVWEPFLGKSPVLTEINTILLKNTENHQFWRKYCYTAGFEHGNSSVLS